jgi:YfiH family protein
MQVLRAGAWAQLPRVRHGFSTRALGSMGLSGASDPQAVLRSRQALGRLVDFEWERAVLAAQVHGREVYPVEPAPPWGGRTVLDTDGLCTAEPGVALLTFHADCYPVLLFDPRGPAIATAHAGWRGALKGILPQTLEVMGRAFGTRAEDVHAALGPGICGRCYEVGDEVAEAYRQAGWAPALSRRYLDLQGKGRCNLDLQQVILPQLRAAGLDPARVATDAAPCTLEQSEYLFSHRGHVDGRFLAAIVLA